MVVSADHNWDTKMLSFMTEQPEDWVKHFMIPYIWTL
jgi:hypothetical protein